MPEPGQPIMLPFFPEQLLGLRNRHGRRWAVTQSLAYGGTVPDILARAALFDQRRSADLAVRPSPGIADEGHHLRDEDSDYPSRLLHAGWTVLRWGERWVVEPPASGAG